MPGKWDVLIYKTEAKEKIDEITEKACDQR